MLKVLNFSTLIRQKWMTCEYWKQFLLPLTSTIKAPSSADYGRSLIFRINKLNIKEFDDGKISTHYEDISQDSPM